ncbi:ComF family protein [Sphingomonas sp. FW199]|uniref:ComF family protein n=1 Tax=Sphingomonas sp. FW199 TaxID=3400217 RepID=UPI003CE8F197
MGLGIGQAGWIGRLAASAVALALPPRCPGCGDVVDADHRLCPDCWGGLRFLGPPACALCAQPFDVERGDQARCAPCLAHPPPHDGLRAAVAYGPVARRLALKLKYGGRMSLAETMARMMARHLADDADLLVPVPLHRWRLWSRGFNQAALIAADLSAIRGVPNDPMLLRRVRRTPVLRGISGHDRRRAVRGAFALSTGAQARVAGRHVVLIDDVHTSGATVGACAAVLRLAGAARVTVLTFARVTGDPADDTH